MNVLKFLFFLNLIQSQRMSFDSKFHKIILDSHFGQVLALSRDKGKITYDSFLLMSSSLDKPVTKNQMLNTKLWCLLLCF